MYGFVAEFISSMISKVESCKLTSNHSMTLNNILPFKCTPFTSKNSGSPKDLNVLNESALKIIDFGHLEPSQDPHFVVAVQTLISSNM